MWAGLAYGCSWSRLNKQVSPSGCRVPARFSVCVSNRRDQRTGNLRYCFIPGAPRLLVSAACMMALTVVTSACQESPASPAPKTLTLTMGGPTTPALQLGEALANARAFVPGVQIRLRPSSGTVGNVNALQAGDADIGVTFADIAYFAFVGQLEGGSRPFDRLRGIAVLTLFPVNLVVKSSSGIRDVADLRGKRVGFGAVGTNGLVTPAVVLKAFGIDLDMIHVERVSPPEAWRKLDDGTIDAYFITGYLEPQNAFTGPDRIVLPLAGPAIDRLSQEYAFLRPMRVPPGVYPGGAVRTVGVDWLLVCRSGLDEDVVYNFTKSFFENLQEFSIAVDALKFVDLERAPATPIPLHEGAARYYREREVSR
jgi:TRAP transporter TAXI family solute receptor